MEIWKKMWVGFFSEHSVEAYYYCSFVHGFTTTAGGLCYVNFQYKHSGLDSALFYVRTNTV